MSYRRLRQRARGPPGRVGVDRDREMIQINRASQPTGRTTVYQFTAEYLLLLYLSP